MEMKFKRYRDNPIIPRLPGSFHSIHVANPDILPFRNKLHFYFRGQDEAGHDQIGVAYSDFNMFDGVNWKMSSNNPIIRVSVAETDFDSGYILDPAAIELNNCVYLYYSAHNIKWQNWNIPSYIGLALSEDGTHFVKCKDNPIMPGTAPEVVLYEGSTYLFFQRKNASGYFEIYCSQSRDGIRFDEQSSRRVFGPTNISGTFDRFSISTVRIWQEGGWFYMTYGGCPDYFDYPAAIGLARSDDLLHWQRYPGNPILTRGRPGEWDEGALWFATVFKKDRTYYLWYEGTGAGLGLTSQTARRASRLCREEDYGGYAVSSFSQIGLATFEGVMPDW